MIFLLNITNKNILKNVQHGLLYIMEHTKYPQISWRKEFNHDFTTTFNYT